MYLAEKMGDNWDRDQDYMNFIWEVVRAPWFDEKAFMVLDQMEMMIDGYSPLDINGIKNMIKDIML